MSLKGLFKLRNEIPPIQRNILMIGGILFILAVWVLLTTPLKDNPLLNDPTLLPPEGMTIEAYKATLVKKIPLVQSAILPPPAKVVSAFFESIEKRSLIQCTTMSLALNLGGYFKAIMWALPLGFLIGLIPFFNGAFQKIVDSLRFLPLTAITSLFIIWFGIGSAMKMNFLAFGIIIYLLPTIVQRINEVDDVYIKTVHTLGASSWQKVWSVYFPSVISKLIDDIRVLTAISWTYIIVIENIGSQKGLGQLIWSTGQRQARADVIFAVLILIMVIGVFQDRIFSYLDRVIFPYKYQAKVAYGQANLVHEVSIWDNIFDYVIQSLQYIFIGIYILLAINEVFPFLGELKPLSYLFGDRLWVIHVLFVLILILVFKKPIKMLIQRVWKY